MCPDQPHPTRTGLGPRCPHYQHANKLRQHGDLEGARDTILISIDVDFNNADAWALLSDIYDDMEEPWHAQEAARQAIRSNPKRSDLHVVLGVRLLAVKKPIEALAEFDAAISIKPKLSGAHFNRGLALVDCGRVEEGLAALCHAVELEPGLYGALEEFESLDLLVGLPGFPKAPDGWNEEELDDDEAPGDEDGAHDRSVTRD